MVGCYGQASFYEPLWCGCLYFGLPLKEIDGEAWQRRSRFHAAALSQLTELYPLGLTRPRVTRQNRDAVSFFMLPLARSSILATSDLRNVDYFTQQISSVGSQQGTGSPRHHRYLWLPAVCIGVQPRHHRAHQGDDQNLSRNGHGDGAKDHGGSGLTSLDRRKGRSESGKSRRRPKTIFTDPTGPIVHQSTEIPGKPVGLSGFCTGPTPAPSVLHPTSPP